VGALTDPIIVFDLSWADVLPEWLDIYQYLLTKVMGDRIPDELRKESLDDYRMGLLKELKEWIYRQRVKAREERQRMARARFLRRGRVSYGCPAIFVLDCTEWTNFQPCQTDVAEPCYAPRGQGFQHIRLTRLSGKTNM
jgi:hypothetical protein